MFISEKIKVTRDEFEPDLKLSQHVNYYMNKFEERLNVAVGSSAVNLDGRFSRIRTEETNLGNLMADLMRTEYAADIAICMAGMFRANNVFPRGSFLLKNLYQILPYPDKVFLVDMPGRILRAMLENGVHEYPRYDGRFPVISGCKLTFDPSLEQGQRLLEVTDD